MRGKAVTISGVCGLAVVIAIIFGIIGALNSIALIGGDDTDIEF